MPSSASLPVTLRRCGPATGLAALAGCSSHKGVATQSCMRVAWSCRRPRCALLHISAGTATSNVHGKVDKPMLRWDAMCRDLH